MNNKKAKYHHVLPTNNHTFWKIYDVLSHPDSYPLCLLHKLSFMPNVPDAKAIQWYASGDASVFANLLYMEDLDHNWIKVNMPYSLFIADIL